jgi:hypothetical protein
MTTTTQLSDTKDPAGLMRSWLENESGTYIPSLRDFPFEIMHPLPTPNNEVFGDDVRLKWAHTEPVRFFPLCAEITWASFWCRRGVVITEEHGAYFGFSTAGNGTDVFMTYIPDTSPEFLQYIIPVLRLTAYAVLNRLGIEVEQDIDITEPYIGWGDELS